MALRRACPFYIGYPPMVEEKEAARFERRIQHGCKRVFADGTPCAGSWEDHYGYEPPPRAKAKGAPQGVPNGRAESQGRPPERNARRAALERMYGSKEGH